MNCCFRYKLNCLILLLWTIQLCCCSASAGTSWRGCIDVDDPNALVTIGERSSVCLVIADGVDWSTQGGRSYMRLNFQPIADQYSRFHVPQSYQQLVSYDGPVGKIYGGKNITIHAASQTTVSHQKQYFDGFDRVYPYLTAIIHVQDGVVTEITWDDGCIFCSSKNCNRNTFDFEGFWSYGGGGGGGEYPMSRGCHIPFLTCRDYASTENPQEGPSTTSCDLLLYVVWTGTDSQGSAFQSSQHLFSSNPEDVMAYSGASLSKAEVIGTNFRGVLFTTTPVFNETDGTLYSFDTKQLADMNENDVFYSDTVANNGMQTITLPKRDYSNPYLIDDAATGTRSWKTTCWFLLIVVMANSH